MAEWRHERRSSSGINDQKHTILQSSRKAGTSACVARSDDAAIFDHRQKNPPLREDGQPDRSFGLIWRNFGTDYLRAFGVPERDLDPVHAAFDADFVLPIDLVDNGALSPTGPLADLTLPLLLESLKPVFDDRSPEADDRAFDRSLTVARAFVEAAVARKATMLPCCHAAMLPCCHAAMLPCCHAAMLPWACTSAMQSTRQVPTVASVKLL